jgi:(p)ppGpp synthase/HD superfamily hydrolase
LSRTFSVEIKIIANDEPGLLAKVASSITEVGTNISSVKTNEPEAGIYEFNLDLQVSGRLHLSKVIRKLKNLKAIISVNRIHDQEMRKVKILH